MRWGIAAGRPVVPAPAQVLLDYLAAHPGTPATQRGRVTALTAAHQRAGLPTPGEAEAVRRLLNPGRAARLARARARVEQLLVRLPVTGWPHGLRRRRDAVILLLATAGLSWRRIAALTQADLTITDTAVSIGPQPLAVLDATGVPASCPVAVCRRWAQIAAHAPAASPTNRSSPTATAAAAASTVCPRRCPCRRSTPASRCCANSTTADWPWATATSSTRSPPSRSPPSSPPPTCSPPTPSPSRAGSTPATNERGVAARWRDQPIRDELDDLLDRLETELDRHFGSIGDL
ncbi:hypothetical protein IU487_34490 [Nocardia puris]|uniref:hypothetical protein n=1 Tax=Nocardia puris TaxID=208602 RepID=UPI0018934C5C|nr:hypothetical protein [Nocardia puris]MBF6216108.1 hypothetical protein [Nocardia puris]